MFLNKAEPEIDDDDVEMNMPSIYTEGTIKVPLKAIDVIKQVPKIQLDMGSISDYSEDGGIATITAIGVYGTFEDLENLLIKLEIPFIRTAMREMIQHEVHVHIPGNMGDVATIVKMPCDENGKAFATFEDMVKMLDGGGDAMLAKYVRQHHSLTHTDLAKWNDSIDNETLAARLGDIYVTVKAFKDARHTYPNASIERCQAFANSMAILTDPEFHVALGYEGPSARELLIDDGCRSGKYSRGEHSYEDARALLIDQNGPIFGIPSDNVTAKIKKQASSNDCPVDTQAARNSHPQMH